MKYIIGLLLIISMASISVAETITIVADEWPPFNAEPNSDTEGYMVDIARAVFETRGITVKYTIVPWTRAIVETRLGTYTGVIGASKTDAKNFVFPEEELARNLLAFYVKKGNPWRFTGLESIKQIRLGAIDGYDYRKWLNDYLKANSSNSEKVQIIAGDIPLQRNLKKLLANRIDTVVDTEAAIRWEAKHLGILHEIKNAGYGREPAYCYIAFSPNLAKSQTYANILSQGISELRASGKLKNILNKYGLIDWKNP